MTDVYDARVPTNADLVAMVEPRLSLMEGSELSRHVDILRAALMPCSEAYGLTAKDKEPDRVEWRLTTPKGHEARITLNDLAMAQRAIMATSKTRNERDAARERREKA